VIAVLNYVTLRQPAETLRILVGLGLAAFTFGALAYLLAERALRPVFALANPTDATDARAPAVGVRDRLLLAWLLGSGVPLLFIVAIPLRASEGVNLPTTVPMEVMAVLGLVLGAVTTVFAAGSVAEPLATLRTGLRRVQHGDLDAAVPADDPGEIGLLQVGFNEMVAGLRERRRLEELFGQHVGEEVAREALRGGAPLGGAVCDVTVLFVDLVGSTALAESRPAPEVVVLLNDFFERVVRAVTAEGGWIDKFEGDGALCVFGAPARQDDHSARGLRAARRSWTSCAGSVSRPRSGCPEGTSSPGTSGPSAGTSTR
jgi:adenylate cyclase